MLIIDAAAQCAEKRRELLLEAERERLAAQLPHPPSGIRRTLAWACIRLANRLDGADRYVRPADSGASGWVGGAAGM